MTIRHPAALSIGSAAFALAIALAATPATAQEKAPATAAKDTETIVVTGSILRRTSTETAAPVVTLRVDSLEARGITTVAEGLQRLSANGSGTLSEGWNNGHNFAAGAIAPSLRGLTVQNTLTVINGLRQAIYPLADDGHRNFVDLGTVIDPAIDRIEVLKDGASSTYGADAVAGVVNLIMKKQITGLHLDGSAGLSSHRDGAEQRFDASLGYGSLDQQGYNVFVAGSYRKAEAIYARNRGYPFNSGDLSKVCDGSGSCMEIPASGYVMGVNADGTLGGSTAPLAPIVATFDATANKRTGAYQLLNSDCGAFGSSPVTLPASAAGSTYQPQQCQADLVKRYATVRPSTERYGLATRATFRLGDATEAYLLGTLQHTNTYTQLAPRSLPGTTPPPSSATWSGVILPVWVCAAGKATFAKNYNVSSGCDASNGRLNPDNPFAAAGQTAILRGRYDRPQTVESNARSLRGEAGVDGRFGSNDDWTYNLSITASEVRLQSVSDNYLIPQRLADKIATGEYSFSQPWKNTQAVRDYVAPRNTKTSTSSLWQAQATLSRKLFDLPGGPLQAALGAAYRHEAIDDQSANPENLSAPYTRYLTINAVGAAGARNVKSAFFELGGAIVRQVEANASGRFDSYSTGQSNFSPKLGLKFRPIDQILLRGTWSRGFRIPSFNEAFGLPTTGYATTSVDCKTYAAFCAAHGNNSYVTGQYSLGRTSVGNPGLAPERSRSFTLGAVVEPVRGLSLTLDYFNIKTRDVITSISGAQQDAALAAYLKNGTTNAVAGITVIPGTADAAFPSASPLPGFIQFSFQNGAEQRVEGLDLGLELKRSIGGARLTSSFEATYLIRYELTQADGTVERYDGSLSPCDYSSCSGSPKWRGSWANTLELGPASLTATVYYTAGYDLASVDYAGVVGDCEGSIGASVVAYQNGNPVLCRARATWNTDLSGSVKVAGGFTLYGSVLNLFNTRPPFDPSAAYSLTQYNPAWAQANMIGRYFRIGAKVDF